MTTENGRNRAFGAVTANGNYPSDEGLKVIGPVNFEVVAHSGTGTFTAQKKGLDGTWRAIDDSGTDLAHTAKDSDTVALKGANRVRYAVTLASSLVAAYEINATNTEAGR